MGIVVNKKTKEIENPYWGTTQNLIFRRKMFSKINFDNFMKTTSDTDIIWRLKNYDYKCVYKKNIKVINTIGPDGLSTSKKFRKKRYYYDYYLALKQSILLRLKNENMLVFLLKEPYYIIRDFFNVGLRARIKTIIDYMKIK